MNHNTDPYDMNNPFGIHDSGVKSEHGPQAPASPTTDVPDWSKFPERKVPGLQKQPLQDGNDNGGPPPSGYDLPDAPPPPSMPIMPGPDGGYGHIDDSPAIPEARSMRGAIANLYS